MLGDEGNKRTSSVPVVPWVNKIKKVIDESSATAEQINQVVVPAIDEVLDLTQHSNVVAIDSAANQEGTSSELVDLTGKSPWKR